MVEASRIFHTTLLPTFPHLHNNHKPDSHTLLTNFPRKRHGLLQVLHCSVSTENDTATKTTPTQITVPWGCDIDSLENASPSREAGEVLKQYSVPDWPLLAIYLISEASLQKSSRWSNYISVLPEQPYSLLYWTRAELDRYLEASQISERAIERITNVIGTYNDLRLRIFSKYHDIFPEEVFNLETFKWSFGILFSRLVRLPSMGGRVALVPWADMLNHNCKVETFLDYDKSTKGIVFTTDWQYQPGEQVFISCGRKSNGELLLSYGFVPREGTNPSDSVELSLSLKKSDKCYKEKLEALRKHGLLASHSFPIQITGWPLELMANAYLAVSPPSMRGKFEEMAVAASNKTDVKKDMKYPEIGEQALQFVLDSCETSISKYSKFLQLHNFDLRVSDMEGSVSLKTTPPGLSFHVSPPPPTTSARKFSLVRHSLPTSSMGTRRRNGIVSIRAQQWETKDESATVSPVGGDVETALKVKEWEVGMFHNESEGNTPRNILEEIVWHKDVEVAQLKERRPLFRLKNALDSAPPTKDFVGALRAAYQRTGLTSLIAEVKKASSSRGILREDFDPKHLRLILVTQKKLLEGERGQKIREKDIIVVGESGLFTPDDIAYVQEAGAKAISFSSTSPLPVETSKLLHIIGH
ncbi:hypothetical protein QYF36_007657 [Acer negundo]|nr:hypothetical protein QYF36_007657 [Acer negundo]